MGKTTKQMSAGTGESGAEPVRKIAANLKETAKKAGAKSPGAVKPASTKKAATKKAETKTAAAKKAETKTAAAKKPAARKTAAKKAAPRKTVATGTVANKQISSAERRRMIAETAYLRGESQGFLSDEREDWLFAEAEVDRLLIGADVIVSD